MHLIRFTIIAILCTLPLTAYPQNGARFFPENADYLWPTNAGRYLSSTFAETRSAHFHSALDLKTWGRKGYKVFATRDGILHRIAIGPTGYGKVVYLKHKDGSYSVYAHLLRFEERIQQLADSLRFRDYSFEIDRTLDSLQIPVKRGDVIGLSGASGIGPPHLHFELRTPGENPFNPLITNLTVPDHIAPQFSDLSIEPLSIHTEIEGANRIYTRRAWKQNGRYTFGTIDIRGPIGLGVNVFDQADKVYNAYAVYQLKMFVDGELRFHSKVDSFSYEQANQMFVDRVYPILQKTRAGYQRLYVADGNTLPFYEKREKNGKLKLSPGTHKVTIVASDYYGNTSEASLRLRVKNTNKRLEHVSFAEHKGDSPLSIDNWTWFEGWVNIPKQEFSNLTIAQLGIASSDSTSHQFYDNQKEVSINLDSARDVLFRSSSNDHFIARRILPHSFSIVPSATDQSFAAFQADTFYDTLSVGLMVKVLKPDSVFIRVSPSSQPVKQAYKLGVEIDSTQMKSPHLGLYSYSKRKDKLNYLSSYRLDNYLMASPNDLGIFYILQDTTAPEIRNPKFVKRTDGQWLGYATVTDNRSGIDYRRSQFYINGIRGIAEYEPENARLVYYHPGFSPSSSNELKIIVYDMEGHKTERNFTLHFNNK